ncbi:MAG: hypothetical protein KatS3mg026_0269 [Bacteroidia bacterium]|nr:MAG: hypothetical protein KatS3mg026_0269 [Bacteroidia bacterium]
MRSAFFWMGWGCVVGSLLAQNKVPRMRQLERWSELGFWEKILAHYEAQPHAFSVRQLPYVAEAYLHLSKPTEAFRLFDQSLRQGDFAPEPRHLLMYAQLLHTRGEVQRAAAYYKLYAERASDPGAVSLALLQLSNLSRLGQDTAWKIEPVPALVPWAPVYGAWWSGAELYAITRSPKTGAPLDRAGIPYERIVPSLPGLRYRYHQAVAGALAPDTLIVYLSRGRGNLYLTALGPTGWSRPVRWKRLPFRPSGRVSVYIDPRTQDVYFTREPGPKRGTGRDLYRCVYQENGRYGPPERLPAPINTPYDEDAPFIVGDTLYFASNGPQSVGGYDIFRCVRVGLREWSAPEPMPAPLNSPAHDIYYYPFSPERTYFSSDRTGVFLVYQVQYEPPLPPPAPPAAVAVSESLPSAPPPTPRWVLSGRLVAQDNRSALDGEVILVDSLTGKETVGMRTVEEGKFRLFLPAEGGTFYLYAQAPGYMTHVEVVRLPATTAFAELPPKEIALVPIEMEATFALRNIYFDFGSDRLRPESFPELERLKRLLQENPNIRIRFSGHTDNVGSDKYNQRLSERRAKAVYEWLRKAGVHPIQMEYIGYGKRRPVASNATEEGRALNRRIEMEVVGIRRPALDASAARE